MRLLLVLLLLPACDLFGPTTNAEIEHRAIPTELVSRSDSTLPDLRFRCSTNVGNHGPDRECYQAYDLPDIRHWCYVD